MTKDIIIEFRKKFPRKKTRLIKRNSYRFLIETDPRELEQFLLKALKDQRAELLERAEMAENTINHIEDTLNRVLPREYMLEMIGKIIAKHKSEITGLK